MAPPAYFPSTEHQPGGELRLRRSSLFVLRSVDRKIDIMGKLHAGKDGSLAAVELFGIRPRDTSIVKREGDGIPTQIWCFCRMRIG